MDPTGKEKDGSPTTPGKENLGPTSVAEQLTSSFEEGKQFSGAEAQQIAKKLVEDALSADGREQKDRADAVELENKLLKTQVETVTGNVTALTNQMAEVTRVQEESEAAAIKDNPEALVSLRVKQAQAREEIRQKGVDAEQKKVASTLEAGQDALAKATTSLHIQVAAMAAGVEATKLEELVPDGDPGRLASAATLLKAQAAPEVDPKTGLPVVKPPVIKPPGLTNQPASVKSAGGESRSTAEVMLDKAKGK